MMVIDPLAGRMLLWCLVALWAIGECLSLHVGFPYDRLYLLFAPKVPFLGLIITAATFQYKTWRELADRDERQITDPQWIQFEFRVKDLREKSSLSPTVMPPQVAADLLQLRGMEESLKSWKRSNAAVAARMLRGILPVKYSVPWRLWKAVLSASSERRRGRRTKAMKLCAALSTSTLAKCFTVASPIPSTRAGRSCEQMM
jgi:hypothetical protein